MAGYLVAIYFLIAMAVLIGGIWLTFRTTPPYFDSDLQLVVGLWSFSFVFILLFFYAAHNLGFFINGQFVGPHKNLLNGFLEFMVDLKTDIYIPTFFFVLFVASRLLTYSICAVFNRAFPLTDLSVASRFLFWSVVKSPPIVFGALNAWVLVEALSVPNYWTTAKGYQFLLVILISIFALYLSLSFLGIFRVITSDAPIGPEAQQNIEKICGPFKAFHEKHLSKEAQSFKDPPIWWTVTKTAGDHYFTWRKDQ
jgi:hypothetical protein